MPLSKRRCTNGVIQMAFKSVFEYKKALIDSSRKSKFKKPQFLLRLLRNFCAFCVRSPYSLCALCVDFVFLLGIGLAMVQKNGRLVRPFC